VTHLKRLAATLSTLALALGISYATVAPAEAITEPPFQVCDSSLSFGKINVYRDSPYFDMLVYIGGCTPEISPSNVLVDTDPYGPSHSYKIKVEGGSYGDCHTDSDNHASNPPNAYGKKVYYRTFDHGDCTN
jgi:hypothetical protein